MKKYLYGTTALVAAGAIVGPAAAEDPVKLGVGGWYIFNVGHIDADDGVGAPAAGTRDHIFSRWGIISFSGSTTFDNGLKVGAVFDLKAEATPGGGQFEDSYAWMEFADFRVQLGARNSASNTMHYQSPTPSMFGWGFESPVFTFTAPGTNSTLAYTSTYLTTSGDAEKITVFTPRFSGFQLGVSYTPENCQAANANCAGLFGLGSIGGTFSDTNAGSESIWDVGANYVGSFDEVDVALSFGYTHGEPEVESTVVGAAGSDDLEAFSVGSQLSVGGFTVGAAYRQSNDGGFGGTGISGDFDRENWSVGVRHATGPWGYGVQYVEMDVAAGAGNGEDTVNAIEVGGTYDVGPGVQFAFGYQNISVEDNLSAVGAENDVDAVFVGTAIFF